MQWQRGLFQFGTGHKFTSGAEHNSELDFRNMSVVCLWSKKMTFQVLCIENEGKSMSEDESLPDHLVPWILQCRMTVRCAFFHPFTNFKFSKLKMRKSREVWVRPKNRKSEICKNDE